MLSDNSFIKWLALKAFVINEVSHATKIAIIFIIFFILNVIIKILNDTK